MPLLGETSYKIPIRITDINYGNHAGNDSIVAIIHESRMQWLHFYGFTELNIGGIGLIMSDLCIVFKHEAFYGDILSVKLGIGEISNSGFEIFYQLKVLRGKEEILVAEAKTGMVCFNYSLRKVAPIPGILRQILSP